MGSQSRTWLNDFHLLVIWVRFPIFGVASSCVMPDLGSRCRLSWELSLIKTPGGQRFYGSLVSWTPHSSTLTWKIPWTEEPGRLQSMRSLRVGHDWTTSLSLFTFMRWRRKWQPPPVFLPGESQERGSLVGCCLWGRTESDTTEVT